MSKVLKCGLVVPGCEFVIRGEEADEVLLEALEHARSEHEVEHVTEQLKDRIRAAIRDE